MTGDDLWAEFQAMSADECRAALAFLAGRDPDLFERVIVLTRVERCDA